MDAQAQLAAIPVPTEDHINGLPAESDPTHAALRRAVERRRISYLWVDGDTPPFKPALLPRLYGDGRALFTLATINQRPRYYVIRGDSRWEVGFDCEDACGPDFGTLTDTILTDLEEAFGNGRCSYSGSSLFFPRRERKEWCQCEECLDRYVARWPVVDGSGGCSWSRIDWPKGFATVPNPASWEGNLLAADCALSSLATCRAAEAERRARATAFRASLATNT